MRWQWSLRLATVFQAMTGSMLGSEPPPQRRGAPSEIEALWLSNAYNTWMSPPCKVATYSTASAMACRRTAVSD